MKQLLNFEEVKIEGNKTRRFNVFSNHSGDFLGVIHWRPGWRCYVMSYAPDIDMSFSCDDELNKFGHELEEERKLQLKEKKDG